MSLRVPDVKAEVESALGLRVLADIPHHLMQLVVPSKLPVKPHPVGVSRHNLEFNARNLLCLKPFEREGE